MVRGGLGFLVLAHGAVARLSRRDPSDGVSAHVHQPSLTVGLLPQNPRAKTQRPKTKDPKTKDPKTKDQRQLPHPFASLALRRLVLNALNIEPASDVHQEKVFLRDQKWTNDHYRYEAKARSKNRY